MTKARLFEEKLLNLPPKPGVYLFKDRSGSILYIGKAVNLKSRVASYFRTFAGLDPAKRIMVNRVRDIETMLVDSEVEALLLESNLIQKYRPPFNVDLKDDKSFVYLKVTLEEDWPRVLIVRRVGVLRPRDPNRYFGPFTSTKAVRQTLRFIRKFFPYKICKNPVSKPCLGYHLHRCLGHKTEKMSRKEYQKIVDGVITFLEGNNEGVLAMLKQGMKEAVAKEEYEKAARFRDQIQAIELINQKQKVVGLLGEDQDIVSFLHEDGQGAVNLFWVRQGRLIHREQFLVENTQGMKKEEILESFLDQYYARVTLFPKEVLLPFAIRDCVFLEKLTHAQFLVPKRGKKRQLIVLGEVNAREFFKEKNREQERRERRRTGLLEDLAKILQLPSFPRRIEAYDISNIHGQYAVGSMVVFTNGFPDPSQYRRFKVRTVKGSNDPAMMAEVVRRRFQHLHDWARPDLLLLDGGKGQLGVVCCMLEEKEVKIPVAAIAKRNEEIFFPGRKSSIRLPANSPTLHLVQHLRDEAHRFAISYYRWRHRRALH